MFDKFFVRQFRNVNKSVLMHTNVYKCPKINDITHGPFQNHTFF